MIVLHRPRLQLVLHVPVVMVGMVMMLMVVVVALNWVGVGRVRGARFAITPLIALVPLVGSWMCLRVRLTVRLLGLVLAKLQGGLPSSVVPVAVLLLLLLLLLVFGLATPTAPAAASATRSVTLYRVVLAFRRSLQAVLRLRPACFFTLLTSGAIFVTLFGIASRSRWLTLCWLLFWMLLRSFWRICAPVWLGSGGIFTRAVMMVVRVRVSPGGSSTRLRGDVLCVDKMFFRRRQLLGFWQCW